MRKEIIYFELAISAKCLVYPSLRGCRRESRSVFAGWSNEISLLCGKLCGLQELSHDCCQINPRHLKTHTTITENILSIILTTLAILMRYAVRWHVSPTNYTILVYESAIYQ